MMWYADLCPEPPNRAATTGCGSPPCVHDIVQGGQHVTPMRVVHQVLALRIVRVIGDAHSGHLDVLRVLCDAHVGHLNYLCVLCDAHVPSLCISHVLCESRSEGSVYQLRGTELMERVEALRGATMSRLLYGTATPCLTMSGLLGRFQCICDLGRFIYQGRDTTSMRRTL